MESYLGSKNGSGVYQAIINLIPPHDTYIEAFLGTGAILRKKAPAFRSIGIEIDQTVIDRYDYVEAEIYNACAFDFLGNFDYSTSGETLIYCDPPYMHDTRTSNARYEHELTDDEHIKLLELLLDLPCKVMLSGYRNKVYEQILNTWWRRDFQAMTRGGVSTESIWCNFEPSQIHYHTYAGKNYTDRQRIKRKVASWAKKFEKLPVGERQAIMAALLEVGTE